MSDPISGRWKGQYVFDQEPGMPAGSAHDFSFDLSADEEGSFTGTCFEPSVNELFREDVTVEGFVDEKLISFVKRYPCLLLFDQYKGYMAVPEEEHPDVEYEGEFDDDSKSYKGTLAMYHRYDGADYVQQGTWWMKRD